MHSRNFQSKVSIEFLNLNAVDVLVAARRDSIKAAIPQIIALLGDREDDVRI